MKNKMWKMFSVNNNTVYWYKIAKLVDDYNNTKPTPNANMADLSAGPGLVARKRG